jgi:polyisoprenoid-binding protein YceI
MQRKIWTVAGLAVLSAGLGLGGSAHAADSYVLDAMHTSVSFKVRHLDISWTHGRFNDVAGKLIIDKATPANSSFELTIKVGSIDTNNKRRDGHLLSPDFFNEKQFPLITFKSTAVKPLIGGDGYTVTGDFMLHGVTKTITISVKGGKEAEFPKGVKRVGFSTDDLSLKRTTFGMDKLIQAVGDEVQIAISFEATKK